MSHDHSHSHGTHAHAEMNKSRLGLAALLTGAFMLVEIAGGFWSGSLALLADAGHMFTDFAALSLAWFAAGLAMRPADKKRTYGFDRFSVMVAFVNGLALFLIAGLIVYEAMERLISPEDVTGSLMLGVAFAGLVVNIVGFVVLHGADRDNLNVRGALLHVMGDLLGSVAAIIAAGIILVTGWVQADPILSVIVAMLILRSGWFLVKDAGRILLEAAPEELDTSRITQVLPERIAGVLDVHHVHVWSISEERQIATLHARISTEAKSEDMIRQIKHRLEHEFGIHHATVEIERERCADAHNHAHEQCGCNEKGHEPEMAHAH